MWFLMAPDFLAGTDTKGLHDEFTAHWWLEVGDAVLFFHLHQFLPHQLEVLEVALHAVAVLGGDVGLTQQHQLADVFPCIEQQSSDG